MRILKPVYFILALSILPGCKFTTSKHNFYSYTKSFDLWRFPLVEPYEIISATNAGDWFFKIEDPRFENPDFFADTINKEFQLSDIDSVGIIDSIIVVHSSNFYWPKLSGSYKTIVILDRKNNYIYSADHHYRDYIIKLNELHAKSIKLYSLQPILKAYQANLSLPKEWPD